ncbi:MFS transporter [Salinarimonas rosea]|uniref:MFS transporter n=1 Tax=Salinarimonas rosea TaxID=552063 RepID=UPI0004059B7C|nr:MFS transporter [Salinarimonas rosea]
MRDRPTRSERLEKRAVLRAAPLFGGLALLGAGSSLVASLVALQMTLRDFPEWTLGLVTAGFALGGIAGANFAPRVVARVGHVRSFAALSALLASVILLHALVTGPAAWGLLRIATGILYYGVVLVAESWLNGIATDRSRGRLLAAYMIVFFGSAGLGQLALNLGSARADDLFVVAGMVLALAVVPMTLFRIRREPLDAVEALSPRGLVRERPKPVFGAFVAGVVAGTFYALGAAFASRIGLGMRGTSLFMFSALAGALALQWPIGWLSDHLPRKLVLSAAAAGTSAAAFAIAETPREPWLYAAAFAFGGLAFSLYPLCLSLAGDRLPASRSVGLSRSFLTVFAAGSAAGPLFTSVLLEPFGTRVIFAWPGTAAAVLALVALFARRALPFLKQGFVSVPLGSLNASSMDPRQPPRGRNRPATHERADVTPGGDERPGCGVRT